MEASRQNFLNIVELLIKKGSDVCYFCFIYIKFNIYR